MDSELSSLTDVTTPSPSEMDSSLLGLEEVANGMSSSELPLQVVPLKRIKWRKTQSPQLPVQEKSSISVPKGWTEVGEERLEVKNDDDIIESSITIALTDPITKANMLTPVRSTKCTHIESFDLDSFFMLHNISKVKLRSRRIKTDLSLLRSRDISLHERLNPYLNDAPSKIKHEIVNRTDYVMLKLENKHMGRDNNNLRYFTCPICDKEFDVFNDLYSVDFLQEIIVELNGILINNNAQKSFVDVITKRKHDFSEVTHVVINRDGTYNYHVEDKYRDSLERHELVELLDDEEDTAVATVPIIRQKKKKKRKITIELSDSESLSGEFSRNHLANDGGGDMSNPILIDD